MDDRALGDFVHRFAAALVRVDHRAPVARTRSGGEFNPGIGPHSESVMVELVVQELAAAGEIAATALSVPYPRNSRRRCDLCLGAPAAWEWGLEFKLLRLKGDNGRPNDNMLMHILSPYEQDRSALTDCRKLATSGFGARLGIVIIGFEYPDLPMEPAIASFELLARAAHRLGPRHTATFDGLIHPVHKGGAIFGWEVAPES